jgi:hypothetical protein
LQYSPALFKKAHLFTGGVDVTRYSREYLIPVVSGAASTLRFDLSNDGSSWTSVMEVSNGLLKPNGNILLSSGILQTNSIAPTAANNNITFYNGVGYSGAITQGSAIRLVPTTTQSALGLKGINISTDINQTSTAGYTDIYVSRFDQATGSGSQYFIDLGTNSATHGGGTHTSKFYIVNNGTVNIFRPLATNGSTPSNSAGTGAGTTPTITVTGNDIAGYISIASGTTPTAAANIVTVTFSTALTNTPKSVQLTAANANAAIELTKFYVDQANTTSSLFIIKNSGTALTASTTYLFYYQVTQ